VFALNDQDYCRWLEVEALGRRTGAEEAELASYLGAIAAAEGQVQQWVLDYLEAQQEWHYRHNCGAERADIYRAVAPCLPAEWGERRIARVHGECRHAEDLFTGKMLILDEALQVLCDAGQVEGLRDPVGDPLFRWSPNPEATRKRQEKKLARANRQQARRKKGSGQVRHQPGCPSQAATAAQLDLRTFLASRGEFVGSDE
jgi:hypothetical protein